MLLGMRDVGGVQYLILLRIVVGDTKWMGLIYVVGRVSVWLINQYVMHRNT